MDLCRINLIRNRVPSPRVRRALYGLTLLYMVLAGAALAAVVYRSTTRFVKALNEKHEMGRIETSFQNDYPGQTHVLNYADSLKQRLNDRSAILSQISLTLSQRVPIGHILLGLAAPLPAGTAIIDFSHGSSTGVPNAKPNRIAFTVMTPADTSSETLTAGTLLDLWNREAGLAGRIRDITSEVSQRQIRIARPVLLHRFVATLVTAGQSGGQ